VIAVRLRCVRCGRRDREDGTYLCRPCLGDPAMRAELSEALRFDEPRRYVVAVYKWAGGWDLLRHART
jgi:hypothetical protein